MTGAKKRGRPPGSVKKTPKRPAAAQQKRSPPKLPEGSITVKFPGTQDRHYTVVRSIGRAYRGPHPEKFVYNRLSLVPGTWGTVRLGGMVHKWGIDEDEETRLPKYWLEPSEPSTIARVHGQAPQATLEAYKQRLSQYGVSIAGRQSGNAIFALSGNDAAYGKMLEPYQPVSNQPAGPASPQAASGAGSSHASDLLSPPTSPPRRRGRGRPSTTASLSYPAGSNAGSSNADTGSPDAAAAGGVGGSSSGSNSRESNINSPWLGPLSSQEAVLSNLLFKPCKILKQPGAKGRWTAAAADDTAVTLTTQILHGMDTVQVVLQPTMGPGEGMDCSVSMLHDGRQAAVDLQCISGGRLQHVLQNAGQLRDLLMFLGECTMCSGCCNARYKPFVEYHGSVFYKHRRPSCRSNTSGQQQPLYRVRQHLPRTRNSRKHHP